MREIIVEDNKVFYKDELETEGKFSKPEKQNLRHIQVDRNGLDNFLKEVSLRHMNIRFISLSAKIFGKNATYDILIEEAYSTSEIGKNLKETNNKVDPPKGIKAKILIEEGVFISFTGKKLKPGDFFFEKVLLDGRIIELPINVERVIDGVDGLYQIVTDADGTWGYNV